MKSGFCAVAREGWQLLAIEMAGASVLSASLYFMSPAFLVPAAVLFLIVMIFTLFFFREPYFVPLKPDYGIILSPSYGTVLETGLEAGQQVIRIFLSIFDVHSQYSPVDGVVKSVCAFDGTFLPAFKKEASLNRKNLIEISLIRGETLGIEQIAGSIARRISCPLKAGGALRPGGRLGLIYFGSQVAVYLPAETEIIAKPGERVYPCKTVLAKLKINGGNNAIRA